MSYKPCNKEKLHGKHVRTETGMEIGNGDMEICQYSQNLHIFQRSNSKVMIILICKTLFVWPC